MSTPFGQASRSAAAQAAALLVVVAGPPPPSPPRKAHLPPGAGEAAGEDFADVDDERARRPGGAGDHERLAGLGLADLLEPVPACEAGDTEDAQVGRQRQGGIEG